MREEKRLEKEIALNDNKDIYTESEPTFKTSMKIGYLE